MAKINLDHPTPPGSISSSEQTTALPEEWVVKYSKSRKGKIYYFNTITKQSTWKKPQPIPDVQESASLDATNKKPTKIRLEQEVQESGKPDSVPKKMVSSAPISVVTVKKNASTLLDESSNIKGNSQGSALGQVAKHEYSDIQRARVGQETSAKSVSNKFSFSSASNTATSRKIQLKVIKTPLDSSDSSQHLAPSEEAAQSGTVSSLSSFRRNIDQTLTSSVDTLSPVVLGGASLENILTNQGSLSKRKRKGSLDQRSEIKKLKPDWNGASSSGALVHEQSSFSSLAASSAEENLHSQTYTPPVFSLETSNTNRSPFLKDTGFINTNSSHVNGENASFYSNNINLHRRSPTKWIDLIPTPSISSKQPTRTLQSTDYQASSSLSFSGENCAENDFVPEVAKLLRDSDNWNWSAGFICNSDLGSGENAEPVQEIEDMEVSEEGILIQIERQSASTETLTQAIPEGSSAAEESKPDTDKSKIILVIDTNVLISNLKFLRRILWYEFPDWGKPTLILPWLVVQELDCLKNRSHGYSANQNIQKVPSTSFRAAEAVRFIYTQLVNQNPHLIGQTPQQATQAAQETHIDQTIEGDCNDDKILQCSLQFQCKYPKSLIVLITRDINLINKAMIMGIKAATNETLWTLLNLPRPPFATELEYGEPETGKRGRKSAGEDPASNKSNKSDPKTPHAAVVKKSKVMPQKSDTGTPPAVSSQSNSDISHAVGGQANTGRPPVVDDTANSGSSVASSKPKTGTSSKVSSKPPVRKVNPSDQNSDLAPKANNSEIAVEKTEPDAEKALVLNKFDTVWRLIHGIKCGAASVLAAGQSHDNFAEAAKMIRVIRPLLSKLQDIFSRCLSLSPLVLLDNMSEFNDFCECLNSFFNQVHITYCDPSQPLEPLQLVKHFKERGNRITLLIGLEQLSTFLVDIDNLINLPC